MMLPFQLPGTGLHPGAGEQMISSVVQAAIRALLTRVDDLSVAIECQPPSKVLQGALDSFRLQGRGLVIKNQFRAESLQVATDAIAIDLGALLGGRVRLMRQFDAVASVVLNEADINAAFAAPLATGKLRGIPIGDGSGATVAFGGTEVALGDGNRIGIRTCLTRDGASETSALAFSARLNVEDQRRIVLTDVSCESGDAAWIELFVGHFNRIMDIDQFNLDGATLRVHRLRLREGQLIFEGRARIHHFPGSKGL